MTYSIWNAKKVNPARASRINSSDNITISVSSKLPVKNSMIATYNPFAKKYEESVESTMAVVRRESIKTSL